ncbi:hypothetical protein SAM23877_0404 [Streptomyces ambofaciens ATCC 23877]|uniref:Uncharacterized protein n=1 Tax=Streptomyces ambofaciens (strain ATCC 23877 / 3486 / DSM 40053 / JCM 4204 / NBRC 12836 / NRRL B-2516) TaxID=278992 RepID=A0A0K2AKB4_STRA7|nr:hypothetical protein SAM23877_0404 [Streptomyces ambofaciens ATCC 23877]
MSPVTRRASGGCGRARRWSMTRVARRVARSLPSRCRSLMCASSMPRSPLKAGPAAAPVREGVRPLQHLTVFLRIPLESLEWVRQCDQVVGRRKGGGDRAPDGKGLSHGTLAGLGTGEHDPPRRRGWRGR